MTFASLQGGKPGIIPITCNNPSAWEGCPCLFYEMIDSAKKTL